jgi:hypothetical protein
LARLLTIWLKPQVMKSPNCISTMAGKPSRARPRAAPTAPDSMIGVLRMRFFPNSSRKPSVTLKTPPYSAMSWPIRTRRGCRRSASRRPSRIASTYRISVEAGETSTSGGAEGAGEGAKTSAISRSAVDSGSGAASASSTSASIITLSAARRRSMSPSRRTPRSWSRASKRTTGSLAAHSSNRCFGT